MCQALLKYLETSSETHEAFARAVGVRPATVTAWKQGVKPRPDMMARIADVTGGAVAVTEWFAPAAAPEKSEAA